MSGTASGLLKHCLLATAPGSTSVVPCVCPPSQVFYEQKRQRIQVCQMGVRLLWLGEGLRAFQQLSTHFIFPGKTRTSVFTVTRPGARVLHPSTSRKGEHPMQPGSEPWPRRKLRGRRSSSSWRVPSECPLPGHLSLRLLCFKEHSPGTHAGPPWGPLDAQGKGEEHDRVSLSLLRSLSLWL